MNVSQTPQVITTGGEIYKSVTQLRASGRRIGLVPTMGALHAGHLSLAEAARRDCDVVIVTIFVNPTQFGPSEDFGKYPRTLERDLNLLSSLGVEYVFAPPTEEMYPPGHVTFVDVGGVTETLDGPIRPGHFRGVATVVLKLFQLIPAQAAYFGLKDYQQALVIKRMTADLNLPIEIHACPIVREPDGLAMSSRNAYLSPAERQRALLLSQSLQLAADLVAGGERDALRIMTAIGQVYVDQPSVTLDYAVLADPETLQTLEEITAPCVALVAARVGKTRLIDNRMITL